MKVFLLLFSFFISFISASGQTKISGTVKSKSEGKALAGISVTARENNKPSLLTYALTDENGHYQLTFKSVADSILITVSGLNLKKIAVTYANKNQTQNFDVETEAVVLKEIKVKPPKARRIGDTVNYQVDQFTGKNDRTIGDVLKKMAGIDIKEDGSVTYNDKPINKFYIEGQDLLQGRYNIATNNIEAKDVETVQVLENHQPIKALKNKEFVDKAAINLKLKDNAKNVLVSNAQLGAGAAPFLWNNELFGMYFGKGRQFMGTYKGNNTGDDSAGELKNFYGGNWNLDFPVSLGIQSPSGPGVGRKRYLLNHDNALSLSNLWIIGKDYNLTANLSYLNDYQNKDSYSRSENYLPGDSTLVIEERMKSIEKFHYIDAIVKLNANKENFYFDNSLKFSGDLQRVEKGSVDNSQSIFQERSAPYFRLSNDFSMIKNSKKRTFRISSYNGYGHILDQLIVQPLLYPDLFNDAGSITSMDQSLDQRLFASHNSIALGIDYGRFKQNYYFAANATLLELESALQAGLENGAPGITADSLSNKLHWNQYDVFLSPDYTYADKKLKATVRFPLSYINQNSNEAYSDTQKNINRLFFSPSLNIQYKLNLLWTINGSAGYSRNMGGAGNEYKGYIMQSYRYLSRNEGDMPESNTQSYSMSLEYRHPIHLLYATFGGSYYRSKMNLLFGNKYQDFLAFRRTFSIPNTSDGFNLSSNVEKGLDGVIKKLSLNVGYGNSENSQLNQNQIVNFFNKYYSAGTGLNGKFGEWSDFYYDLRFSRNENRLKDDDQNVDPINAVSQSGQFNIFPAKNFIINLKYEYSYNSAATGSGRMMNFADAGIKYRLKKLDFNIEYNNIFNTTRYISASYNAISSYYSSYDLRPTQILLKMRFKIK